MKRVLTTLAIAALAAGAVRAEEAPVKNWKDTAQFSFLDANGNTDSTTLGASNLFTWTRNKWTLLLPAGALNTKSNGVRTAEQYYAGEKVEFKIDARNYLFERYQWERNVFAGFAHRHDLSGGVGREWFKTPTDNFLTELGAGYINEQRVASDRVTFGSGRGYAKYAHKLSATADFSQDAEYLHNLKESKDYRFNAETALTAALTTRMSLKLSYALKFRNTPPPAFGKTDTLTAVSLIVNY